GLTGESDDRGSNPSTGETRAAPRRTFKALFSGGFVGSLEKLGSTLLRRGSPNTDIVNLAGVIERAESYSPGAKRLVFSHHDGFRQVVEIDLDRSIGQFAFQPDLVPNIQTPIDTF